MTNNLFIDGKQISAACKPYLIAELSGNHNNDINRAIAIIKAAKEAGADAVKLQTYSADTMTIDHAGPGFLIEEGPWKGRSLYDLYKEAATPWEWHAPLFKAAKDLGISIFSSPFDESAVDFLDTLNAPAYKIASFEMMDYGLIRYAAAKGKPVIMSTGMANYEEISGAVDAVRSATDDPFVLLHCVSSYPAITEDCNLRMIPELEKRYPIIPGLSDHTLGTVASTVAVGLGACVIEKHLTLARADGGPDSGFSLEPQEFKNLRESCDMAWLALGNADKKHGAAETENRQYRRSVYVVTDMQKGDVFTKDNIRKIRPGFGLSADSYDAILGKKASRHLDRGTPLSLKDVE